MQEAVAPVSAVAVPLFAGPWLPLVLLWQALGLFPLRHVGRGGWATSRPLLAASVLGVVVNGIILSEVLTITVLYKGPDTNSSPLRRGLYNFSRMLFAMSGLPCVVWSLLAAGRSARFYNSLMLLVAELRPAGQSVWPEGWSVRGLLVPLLMLTMTLLRELLQKAGVLSSVLNSSLYLYVFTVPVLVELQYTMTCCTLCLGFRRLSTHVEALRGPSTRTPSARWVDAARRAHEQLMALTAELHGLRGPQLLVTVSTSQLGLLVALYNLAANVMLSLPDGGPGRADLDDGWLLRALTDTTYFAVRLVCVCSAGDSLNEAAVEVQIQSLRVDPESWDPRGKEKWTLFLDQLEALPAKCTASGIFRIGMELLASISATTLSYLLVLLQFDSNYM